MIISDLRLQNFRCFEDFQLHLQDDLNVIVANNGGGKTSILDSIAIAFGPFLTRLPNVVGKGFGKNDLRITADFKRAPFKAIAARIYHDEKRTEWTRLERRDKSAQTSIEIEKELEKYNEINKYNLVTSGTRLKELYAFADSYIDSFNQDLCFELPVLAYYGIERNAFAVPERRRGFQKEFDRFDAYRGCLDPRTNFKKFFEYFTYLETREDKEIRELKDFDHRVNELEVIRTAITTFFKELSNPRTELGPLRFLIDQKRHGILRTFDIRDLSDGYRTTIGVVMDLASRMAEANPHLGIRALMSKGVVLIDEIDMHLHPSWQQEIIADFRRTFPNIQLICTTHSPQVLSTVPNDRIIALDDSHQPSSPNLQTKGVSSASLLSRVMEVDPIPATEEALQISRLRALIESGQFDSSEGHELRDRLVKYFSIDHPEIIKLGQLAKLQAFKHKLKLGKEKSGPSPSM